MKQTTRIDTLILSDNHFGSDVDPEMTGGLAYGKKEERAAIQYVVKQAADYKRKYRDVSGLNLIIDGDLIAGTTHDRPYYAPMSEQIERARKNYQLAIDELCDEFPVATVTMLGGNHDRRSDTHPGIATKGRWDSHATDIFRALKAPKNCAFIIPTTPYAELDVFGWKFLATHGDTMIKIANPGKSVNMARVEAQINRWTVTRWKPNAVILGHHHVPLVTPISRDTTLIVNGSTVPGDEFSLSVDHPETPCAQVLFESTKDHAVGDLRIVFIPRSIYGGKN